MGDIQNRESEYISINHLQLDPQNPRLPSELSGEVENEILRWMVLHGSVTDIMRSIGEQGYFTGEPLLVVKTKESSFTVVEGNRRLAAIKLLHDPDLTEIKHGSIAAIVKEATEFPTEVPCIVYDHRDEILDYLGFRHVTGIKSWGPLAKARYLQDLSQSSMYAQVDEQHKYRKLAKSIGSRVDYVKRLLSGLKLYEQIRQCDYYDIANLDETKISFSLITTALGQPNIVSFLGLEKAQDLDQSKLIPENLEELTRWMFERIDGRTRLGESRHFGDLNQVVGNDIALQEFRSGRTLSEALLFTDAPAESFRNLLKLAKGNLQVSQDQLNSVRSGLRISDRDLMEDIRFLVDDVEAALVQRLRRERISDPQQFIK